MDPSPSDGPRAPRTGLATTSLVLGILANVCLWFLAGIPAVVTGHIALRRARRSPDRHGGAGMAISGLVLGYVSMLLGAVMLALLASLFLPAIAEKRSRATEETCLNNLRQLGVAARDYANDHQDRFPTNFAQFGPSLSSAKVLICPRDPGREPFQGTDWSELKSTNVSYVLLTPGALASETVSQPVFRCPIHRGVTLGDGSVQSEAPGGR